MILGKDQSSDQLDTRVVFTSLRASHFVCSKLANSLYVPCSDAPFFFLLAFRYFMAPIQRKIHGKTGSHNDSKIYSAMLKRVESKKCTIPIRHHNVAVPIYNY